MNIKIAVLTVVSGRRTALMNLIKGLALNEPLPAELIIVHMNEDTYALPPSPFPIRTISHYDSAKLPLASARNLALAESRVEHCIFLDVDCIPAPNLINVYAEAFSRTDQLWSGQVRYLTPDFSAALNVADLEVKSMCDPIRGKLHALPYELFWSLNFACSKTVFRKIGGFDESYKGYGAEDTDFAFMARAQGIPLELVNAMAYHQPHASYDPPLNHLEDIVNNAHTFYKKWKLWPMEGWLKKFVQLGYISWSNDEINILAYPEKSFIGQYLK